tara:strand:- start:83 stop:466 length:384 start_codon:yes stop_codon:yes gene_type:complete
MKLYKIIILLFIIPSIYIAQFSEVLIDIDYSNISEKEMFIFENFESEIQAYFMNNYFFDDPDELEMTLDMHIVIENVNTKGGETIISAQILFSNQKDQTITQKVLIFYIIEERRYIKQKCFILSLHY